MSDLLALCEYLFMDGQYAACRNIIQVGGLHQVGYRIYTFRVENRPQKKHSSFTHEIQKEEALMQNISVSKSLCLIFSKCFQFPEKNSLV